MKHFVYTVSRREWKAAGVWKHMKKCQLYRVIRNKLEFVGTLEDDFVDDAQLAWMTLEKFKQLPRKYFTEKNEHDRLVWSLAKCQESGVLWMRQLS